MLLVRHLLFLLTFLASTVFTHDADTKEPESAVKHNYQASFNIGSLEYGTRLSLFYTERCGASA